MTVFIMKNMPEQQEHPSWNSNADQARNKMGKRLRFQRKKQKIKARTEVETALDAAIPDDGKILRTTASFVKRDGKIYYVAAAEVLEQVGICVAP